LCGLAPEKEYPIVELERTGGYNSNLIIVYYSSELYPGRDIPYLLPEAYAKMFKDEDIRKVNSIQVKNSLKKK